MQGIIEINGKKYVERMVIIPDMANVTVAGQVIPGRIVLPGTAPFLLKSLTREVLITATGVPSPLTRFKFKLGNSDGSTWYSAAGVGGTTDRVIDTLCFGDAKFPFPMIPPAVFSATSSIMYEVEDVSGIGGGAYTVHLAMHGSWLFPLQS